MMTIVKIDRISAWVLFVGIFLYFVSGYGMTMGIIDPSFATKIHLDYLSVVVLVAFVLHTSFAIHLAFKRWGIWNWFFKIILVLFYLSIVGGFIYVNNFYVKKQSSPISKQTPVQTQNNITLPQSQANSSTRNTVPNQKNFTLQELAKYNGKNGTPAYVAVSGKVYDMSSVFVNGIHNGYSAGQDLTNNFFAKHSISYLSRVPVVGVLK